MRLHVKRIACEPREHAATHAQMRGPTPERKLLVAQQHDAGHQLREAVLQMSGPGRVAGALGVGQVIGFPQDGDRAVAGPDHQCGVGLKLIHGRMISLTQVETCWHADAGARGPDWGCRQAKFLQVKRSAARVGSWVRA